jgi:hypothetical protein
MKLLSLQLTPVQTVVSGPRVSLALMFAGALVLL